MSKSENHWYLAGTALNTARPRARVTWRTVAVWVVLIALFVFFYQSYSSSNGPLDTESLSHWFPWPALLWIWAAMFAVLLPFALVFQRKQRGALLRALQEPTPEPLLAAMNRSMWLGRAHPDAQAIGAHSRAQALALYGRGDEALRELGAVEWSSRAPIVQALGLGSELVQVLLCSGDARRAQELARQASALSALGAAVPGASQTARTYGAYEALTRAMLGVESAEDRTRLEQAATDGRFVFLQLLATYGLACVCERDGDVTRAAQLRDFLQRTAPHCAPLHAPLIASAPVVVQGPVSSALANGAPPAGQGPQARAAQQALRKTGGRLVKLYLVLVVLFAFFWLYIKYGG